MEVGGACFQLAPDDRYFSAQVSTDVTVNDYRFSRSVPFRVRFEDALGVAISPISTNILCGSVFMMPVPTGAARLVVDPSESDGTNIFTTCPPAETGTISTAFYWSEWGF